MRVAVVDIGSSTARLLVAGRGVHAVDPVHEERALLALGDEIERHGALSDVKLRETAERACGYVRTARELGCRSVDVIVTAPGRQSANAGTLVAMLEEATGLPVRVLSSEEEGRLAYEGAVAQARGLPDRIAVCDVGGGSTELVFGQVRSGPEVCRSLELGSLRLARRFLDDDPPGKKAIARARREVERRFDEVRLPPVDGALATGGSARSLRRLTGTRTLGTKELTGAVRAIAGCTVAQIMRELGLDPVRAQSLLAGALILAETQRRLGLALEVARGGLREGVAFSLLSSPAAA
jgi:exopolyphosphatase/guanosine-5'-triphosphate,3'-diphosphate pyrophosphatase